MGAGKLILVSLVLVQVLLVHAMADKSEVRVRNEDEPAGRVVPREADESAGRVVPREADEPAGRVVPREADEPAEADAQEINRRLGKHHLSDKSVAAGGVIIGGLVTVTFVAVFAYIRVTRKGDGVKH